MYLGNLSLLKRKHQANRAAILYKTKCGRYRSVLVLDLSRNVVGDIKLDTVLYPISSLASKKGYRSFRISSLQKKLVRRWDSGSIRRRQGDFAQV